MKKCKQFLFLLLAIAILLTAAPTAFAAVDDTKFSDVSSDAWYADAVEYVRVNGLMSGTTDTTFDPNGTMTRAMLATTLYRAAGSPSVSGTDSFADTVDNTWYAAPILWASRGGVISGYGGGLFGTNDPVSREQIATILWRYEGSPVPDVGQSFADESSIASYAVDAVDWARANGIVNGKTNNLFDPTGNATRVEVATILRNYMTMKQNGSQTPDDGKSNTLVIYFSATGSTETVAKYISEALDTDLYEIVPKDPYTSADLNWNTPSSRVNAEHENPDFRPAIAGEAKNLANYDTVFLGYPIWWGEAPNIVRTFMENSNLDGKTIIPFCTSSSSGLGSSAETLRAYAPNAKWLNGQRFSSRASQSDVREWVRGLKLE